MEIRHESVTVGVGLSTLPNVFDLFLGDRSGAWRRPVMGLAGIAVLVLGIWGFMTRAVGVHVTDCGFDPHGAYAEVRVDNWLGGAHEQNVQVAFHVNGDVAHYPEGEDSYYDVGVATAEVPAHGQGMAVVHGGFPPHGEFRDPTAADLHVEGGTVYHWYGPLGGDRLVSRTFALEHWRRTVKETVPDDRNAVDCSIVDEDD